MVIWFLFFSLLKWYITLIDLRILKKSLNPWDKSHLIMEPQQHMIQVTTATYTRAHGNVGSLSHLVRPGDEPESSWILLRFISVEPQQELLILLMYCWNWFTNIFFSFHGFSFHRSFIYFFKLLNEFYYIYRCTTIITTKLMLY